MPCERSVETIQALERLLADALDGKITGLVCGARYQGRDYTIDITGSAKASLQDVTYSMGMIKILDQELADIFRITAKPPNA